MASRLTDRRFLWPDHVDLLSRRFVDVAMGITPRLLVLMPPAHGKSWVVSWYGPTWYLSHFPDRRIMLASYGADYAALWGRKVRNTIHEHGEALGLGVREDTAAANEWETTAGGGMVTAGLAGGLTGRHAELFVVDDPFKNAEEANSGVYRERVWENWQSAVLTRLRPDAGVFVMQTRWHEDDLAGRILNGPTADGWEVLRLPAIAEQDDPLGRAPGAALWPAMFDEAALAQRRLEIGEYYWESLYQQKPPPLKGGTLYGSFDPDRNVDAGVRLVDDLPLQLSVDFNRNPGMHGILGQHFPHEDLITARHVIHAPRMHIKGMCAELHRMLSEGELKDRKFPYVEVFGDASGRIESMADGKSSWDSVQSELIHYGIPYRLNVPRHNPGVFDRVNTVNESFAAPDGRVRYKIHPDCVPLIRDYKQMKADEQGEENKRDKLLSHASSAEGYRIVILMPILKTEMSSGRVLFSA